MSKLFIFLFSVFALNSYAKVLVPVGEGYCKTSINTAVFRSSSVTSLGDNQYVAYYDPDGYVTVGKRRLNENNWTTKRTQYKGNVTDAHNIISIGIDGDGYIHLSFDHHGHPLHYCRSTSPDSLDFGPLESMLGENEDDITYPEFHSLPGGDLLFAYRSGASGRGNLVLNRYDITTTKWSRVHDILIDGENERNAYWQMFVDINGTIHLSWVWRETWLVETNHDLCYACSTDGGRTWMRSDGTAYSLPITLATAEVAWTIPQNSELINQTGMTADSDGHPYIATYWRSIGDSVPQYRLVWNDGKTWNMSIVGNRKTPFTLSGGGTKMIQISRPRIACDNKEAYYIFRDIERGSRVSIAYTPSIGTADWTISDLTDFAVDAWEPTFDTNLWNNSRHLHIFVQRTHQGDGEKISDISENSSTIQILEYK